MNQRINPTVVHPKRADLHCHSVASTEADEAALIAIGCPESYSAPEEVYAQARSRDMDFFTITDHDSLEGVAQIADRPNVLFGEELTCYFPEDDCKMHVLVWGLTHEDHDALQAVAADIYKVAEYIELKQLAHSVAHPVYRQNDLLERWHLERLMLLFKGFECLNGAHSVLHREAFEPMLDELTPQRIEQLARRHRLAPRWNEPWKKARTAGSDDHGLFNIGRTWTEFPPDCVTVQDVLKCLREGRCQPGGEAGSSVKLAHNFFSVAIRYVGNVMTPRSQARAGSGDMLQMLIGGRRLRTRDLLAMAVRNKLRGLRRRVLRPFRRPEPRGGTAMLMDLFESSLKLRIGDHPRIGAALREGRAPLSEHEAMFNLMGALNRDVTRGICTAVSEGLARGELGPIFDSLSAVAAQQFLLMPYYFSLFHQNRERIHLPRITGFGNDLSAKTLRVGLFTDSLDGQGDVAVFTRSLASQATTRGHQLTVHTCSAPAETVEAWRKNFEPLATAGLPLFPGHTVSLPPLAEILEWADRQQFDVIHVETAGPMGLVGWLTAKMLHVPLFCASHVDLPALVKAATGDYRLTLAMTASTGWFYQQADIVLTRSRAAEPGIRAIGVKPEKLSMIPPEFEASAFDPAHREADHWNKLAVAQPLRLLYRGPVAVERNLPMLADAFERLCRMRSDVALIVIGAGPYLPAMQKRLAHLPVYFNPARPASDAADPVVRAVDYASSDLFVFPSRIETSARAVIEAQASGLPVMVADEGASAEMMDDGVSGLVLPSARPEAWAAAINALLNDAVRLQRMSRTAPHRVTRFARPRALDMLWDEYLRAARAHRERAAAAPGHETGAEMAQQPATGLEVTTS